MIDNIIQTLGPWLPLILAWSIFWKGLGLWHSAQSKQPIWFIVLLVLNTVGILDIIYLFAVRRLKFSELFSSVSSNSLRSSNSSSQQDII